MSERKRIIIAGSGPSLARTLETLTPDLPIAAVSTAIRVVPHPAMWYSIDGATDAHGLAGQSALRRRSLPKYFGQDKEKWRAFPAMTTFALGRPDQHEESLFPVMELPLLHCGLSMLMAVQHLIVLGYRDLVFAGVDLSPNGEQPYAYETVPEVKPDLRRRIESYRRKAHKVCGDTLERWCPMAAEKGIRFLSLSPGRINEFMEQSTCRKLT